MARALDQWMSRLRGWAKGFGSQRQSGTSVPSSEIARLTDKFEADLADRRAIERELAHLASFAEMDPNLILETDLSGNVLYQNIAAHDAFPDLAEGSTHPLLEG